MKKLLFCVVIATILPLIGCKGKENAKPQSFKENPASDFSYTLTDDGKGVKITKYIGKSEKIIIPATIEGLPVLEVEKLADKDTEFGESSWNPFTESWVSPKCNDKITHIVFPDSVRKTGSSFIDNWEPLDLTHFVALEYIKLPAGIEEYERPKNKYYDIYYQSHSETLMNEVTGTPLKETYLPYVEYCDNLKTVIIPEGPTVIRSFDKNPLLEKVVLPSTVTFISEDAFYGCENLSEITIPESVSKICFTYMETNELGKSRSTTRAFEGTSLNLTTQTRLKELGYTGKF